MSSSRYWELTVEVPEETSEGLTNFVWELGALGVVEEEVPGGRPRLRAFFPKTIVASTLGCLERLESLIARAAPLRLIDLGTGSGVLAIAAARLGVGQILAVDDDPDAVASAIANAARNRVCDRVRCILGDAGALDESG